MAEDKTPTEQPQDEKQLTLPGFEDLGESERTPIADMSQLMEVLTATKTHTAGELASVLDFLSTYFPDENETRRFAAYLKQIEIFQ